jgi:DNA-binding SARP family transcriptional activator
MSVTLGVRCFGTFAFRGSGEWTSGPAFKRGRELLQYLVAYPRTAASRGTLAEAFWPELDADAISHRLHIAVSGARAALRAVMPQIEAIRCTAGMYAWAEAVNVESDVAAFLNLARESSVEAMRAGVALYSGEFLAGEEAEWMYSLRVRCSSAYASMLEGLTQDASARGDHAGALNYALLLAESDRAHEGATRCAMEAFAALGRRGAALAEYEALARYLKRHLGIAPSAATMKLREAIALGD